MRDHGRSAIWVASDLLRGEEGHCVARDAPGGHRRQPARHARRAAAKFVHLATRYRGARARWPAIAARDGRQEHHGDPAAGGGARIRRSRSPPTAPTRRDAVDALVALVAVRVRRGRMQRLKGHRRLAGRRRRPRGRADPARAGAALSDCAGAARPRSCARLDESRAPLARAAGRHPGARRAAAA